MALIVDHQQQQEQPQHKHYCRICKKGFGCGQALGGHMRAHGISDDIFSMNDEDEDHTSYDWDPNASKCMYSLRTNPNRLKTCRVCENCGIEFTSWKSFLEHGKCISDDAGESFPRSELEETHPIEDSKQNWSKRKRSYRAEVGSYINSNCPSSEEEELAHCLMMLSNGIVEHFAVDDIEESCATASKYEARGHNVYPYNQNYKSSEKLVSPKGLFECKACKKVFNSHQALGGHRASHKKVKGCFAAKLDDHIEDNQVYGTITQKELYHHNNIQYDHNESSMKKKAKVHECSICYRVFSSGQALGGHKRCHWITSKNSPDHASDRSAIKFNNNQFYNQEGVVMNNLHKDLGTLDLTLDLNFRTLDAKPKHNQNSQEILLLPWKGGEEDCEKEDVDKFADDETKTETKFAKLSELKQTNLSETSSQWLQVGLGSTSSQVPSDP